MQVRQKENKKQKNCLAMSFIRGWQKNKNKTFYVSWKKHSYPDSELTWSDLMRSSLSWKTRVFRWMVYWGNATRPRLTSSTEESWPCPPPAASSSSSESDKENSSKIRENTARGPGHTRRDGPAKSLALRNTWHRITVQFLLIWMSDFTNYFQIKIKIRGIHYSEAEANLPLAAEGRWTTS